MSDGLISPRGPQLSSYILFQDCPIKKVPLVTLQKTKTNPYVIVAIERGDEIAVYDADAYHRDQYEKRFSSSEKVHYQVVEQLGEAPKQWTVRAPESERFFPPSCESLAWTVILLRQNPGSEQAKKIQTAILHNLPEDFFSVDLTEILRIVLKVNSSCLPALFGLGLFNKLDLLQALSLPAETPARPAPKRHKSSPDISTDFPRKGESPRSPTAAAPWYQQGALASPRRSPKNSPRPSSQHSPRAALPSEPPVIPHSPRAPLPSEPPVIPHSPHAPLPSAPPVIPHSPRAPLPSAPPVIPHSPRAPLPSAPPVIPHSPRAPLPSAPPVIPHSPHAPLPSPRASPRYEAVEEGATLVEQSQNFNRKRTVSTGHKRAVPPLQMPPSSTHSQAISPHPTEGNESHRRRALTPQGRKFEHSYPNSLPVRESPRQLALGQEKLLRTKKSQEILKQIQTAKGLEDPLLILLAHALSAEGEMAKQLLVKEIEAVTQDSLLCRLGKISGEKSLTPKALIDAVKEFHSFLAENRSTLSLTLLAKIYLIRGELEKAKEALKQLLKKNSWNAFALIEIGCLYRKANHTKEAIQAFTDALETTNSHFVLEQLGDLNSSEEQEAEAQKRYQQILDEHPGNLAVQRKLLFSFLSLNNFNAARELCTEILQKIPEDPFALGVQLEFINKDKAISHYSNALEDSLSLRRLFQLNPAERAYAEDPNFYTFLNLINNSEESRQFGLMVQGYCAYQNEPQYKALLEVMMDSKQFKEKFEGKHGSLPIC